MNIYTLRKDGSRHIGKRWANGVWCWTCKVRADFLNKLYVCPRCLRQTEHLSFNPAFRELGFDKRREIKHKVGINGASGFVWHAKNRADALEQLQGITKVKTEYGDYWTIARFWRMFDDVIEQTYDDHDFS